MCQELQSQLTDCAPVLEALKGTGEQLKVLSTGAGAAVVEATVTKDSWRYDKVSEALSKNMEKLTTQRQQSFEVCLQLHCIFIFTELL